MQPGIDYIGIITPFFCHDGSGNFLFYQRSGNAKDERGKWDCSGGSLQFGEQLVDAVKRKLKIQYRCDGVIEKQLPATSLVIDIDGVNNHWVAVPFIVKVKPEEVSIGEPEKMTNIRWAKLDNLPTPLHPGAEQILRRFETDFKEYSGK